MKTPMQELIDIIKKRKEDDEAIPFMYNDKIIDLAESLLEKEKELIMDAVDAVNLVARKYSENGEFKDDNIGKEVSLSKDCIGLSTTGKDYYNITFNTKER